MSNSADSLHESSLTSLPLTRKGKVRDIYGIDDRHMLMVATDRISAFDVILPTPINGKGRILTSISRFWFKYFRTVIPNHLSDLDPKSILSEKEYHQIKGRALVVKKLRPLPVEAIVRGYLTGSSWKDYQANGTICGITLAAGMMLSDKLPTAIYTPSTKASVGSHDINISYEETVKLLGKTLADQVRQTSLQIYTSAAEYALERGIIIADTKFEFGLNEHDELILIDEILTPDSSRFWSASTYKPGTSQPGFDKQYVRDYLETLDWNKTSPGPELPDDIVQHAARKYFEAQRLLTG